MFNKIYQRFFIGFLGTVFLVLGLIFLYIHFMFIPPDSHTDYTLEKAMLSWEGTIRKGGADSYKQHIRNNPMGYTSTIYLLDANGNDISHRPLPPPALKDINNFIKDKSSSEYQSDFLRIKQIKDNIGHHWYLVGFAVDEHLDSISNNPPSKVMMLIVFAVAICAAISLLLAIYLTKPISILQTATEKIIHGHLDTKIDPEICNRKDELGLLATAFNNMTEKLQSTQSEQRKLLRNISHELRSPLARAGVAIDLAKQKNDSDSKDLDRIDTEIYRLNDLIGQILKLPTLGENYIHDFDDTIDLNGLIRSICHDAEYEAQLKQIKIIFNSPKQQMLIKTTSNLLHSAIENIIRNSLKHSPNNKSIEVGLICTDNSYKIEVCDQGPGVPAEHLDKIFTPFHRVTGNSKAKHEGYGLGLAISHGAVQLHGGTIVASNIFELDNNKPGIIGLKISITLPKDKHLYTS